MAFARRVYKTVSAEYKFGNFMFKTEGYLAKTETYDPNETLIHVITNVK